jgi:hypothetical protein
MVQAEVLGKGLLSPELVLEAINSRLAEEARERSRGTGDRRGFEIKTYFWLDTLETPGREI